MLHVVEQNSSQHGTILFSNIQHVEWQARRKHEVIIDSGGKKSSHHLSFVVTKHGGGGGYSLKNWIGCAARFPKPLPYL